MSLKSDYRKTERRSYFELHEYSNLYRFMWSYVTLTTKDSKVGGVKERTLMVRELLRDLLLFLANTGFRYGTESRSLVGWEGAFIQRYIECDHDAQMNIVELIYRNLK